MGVTDVILFIALACFAIEQINARGRAIGWWGGILVCVALLWGSLFS